jgi:hypothetical protein
VEPREVLLDVLRWWDTFVRSPGLGGLAAVGAAWVGFRQWRRQGRAELDARRERETADRRTRRDEQWWQVYRLAHADRPPRPRRATQREKVLLRALLTGAETGMQSAAASALLEAYAPATTDDEEGTPDGDERSGRS